MGLCSKVEFSRKLIFLQVECFAESLRNHWKKIASLQCLVLR